MSFRPPVAFVVSLGFWLRAVSKAGMAKIHVIRLPCTSCTPCKTVHSPYEACDVAALGLVP